MTQKPSRKICKTAFRPLLCSLPVQEIDVAEAHARMVKFAYDEDWGDLTRSYGKIVAQHAYAILKWPLADLMCRIRDGDKIKAKAGWKFELANGAVPNEIHVILRHDKHPGAWMITQRQMQCRTPESQREYDKREAAIASLCPKPEYYKALEVIHQDLGGWTIDDGMEAHRLPENFRLSRPGDPVQGFIIRALRVKEGKSKGRPVGHVIAKDYHEMRENPVAPDTKAQTTRPTGDMLCYLDSFTDSFGSGEHLPAYNEKNVVMHAISTLEVLKVLSGILVDNGYMERIQKAAAGYVDHVWVQPPGRGGEIVIDAAISSIHAAEGWVAQEVIDRAIDVEMAERAGAVAIKADDFRVFPASLKKAGHVSRETAYFPAQWRYWAEEVEGRLWVRAEMDESLADYRLRIQDSFEFERVDEVLSGELGTFCQVEDVFHDATPKRARSNAVRRTPDFWKAFQIFSWGALMLEGDNPSKTEDHLLERIKEQDERRKKAMA